MKIILVKDCKVGKKDEIVEVRDGYGKNFLISQGYAIPFNKKTLVALNKHKEMKKKVDESSNIKLNKVKIAIEAIKLVFDVKSNNGIIHNSVSKKQIAQELKKHKIKIDSHSIENTKINSLGFINVKITLSKNIIANLKVEVKDGS